MTDPTVAEPIPDTGAATPPSLGATAAREGERGQGMVEYALILILMAMAVLVAVQVLGHSTTALYSNISNGLHVATGG
ncbi:MAG TPA: hypothetical protein VGL20_08765 [Candidatus Dormibacteraeota bacterium]|jgi:Flp pilus assembly pilin Flp